jgi:hypothetical protein
MILEGWESEAIGGASARVDDIRSHADGAGCITWASSLTGNGVAACARAPVRQERTSLLHDALEVARRSSDVHQPRYVELEPVYYNVLPE